MYEMKKPSRGDLHRLIDSHKLICVVPVIEHIVHKLLPSAARNNGALVGWVPCHIPAYQSLVKSSALKDREA